MTASPGKPDPTLEGQVLLVTGANGGLGEHFVLQALERGAAKVYAAARTPRPWADERIVPLHLDLTDAASVTRAAAEASDVTLLINNAAIAPAADRLGGDEAEARRIFETNFFGTMRVANAFAPLFAARGGGTILNIISSAAWIPIPTVYAASKAALGSATNGLRMALEPDGIRVIGLYVGMVDTAMTTQYAVPKSDARDVVAQAYDGIAAGSLEILADDLTRDLKAQMGTAAEHYYPPLHAQLRAFLG